MMTTTAQLTHELRQILQLQSKKFVPNHQLKIKPSQNSTTPSVDEYPPSIPISRRELPDTQTWPQVLQPPRVKITVQELTVLEPTSQWHLA